MKTVSIKKILHEHIPINTEITIYGWVKTRRDSKSKLSFLNICDGSSTNSLQVIAKNNLHNYTNEILHLTTGCSVKINGTITQSIGSQQNIEMIANNITILGWVHSPDTYPISAKKHTMEHLRTFAHLRPRTNIIGSIARIRHTLLQAIHYFMNTQEYIWVPSPIITSHDTEGNGKMFCVSTPSDIKLQNNKCNSTPDAYNFFGKEAFLTVSGQLNIEAYACALSKVYTFGPTFRAEHSNTNRHLAEFWMLEVESAFTDLNDIITLSEHFLKNVIKILLQKHINDIKYLTNKIDINIISQLEKFIDITFNRIEYTDAIKLLAKCSKKFNNPVKWGVDLFSEHEKYLLEKHFKTPVVIINHPKNIKAFYMRLNDDNNTVASMDILLPRIGEIIGGSQREERLSILDQRLQENNLKTENYWWYRDLRRYGTVPHSGFGLGFERLMIYATGIKNIRDVVPFPRTEKYINF